MPYDPQSDNATLMKLYNQEVKTSPELPDRATLLLRARLVFEEACEFVRACGCEVKAGGVTVEEDELEVTEGTEEPSLIEYADACGDQLVVTHGALNAAGIKVEPLWNEIQRSNASKFWAHCSICDEILTVENGDHFHGPDSSHASNSFHDPSSSHACGWSVVLKTHKRADGKVQKPPTWSPPDIEKVLSDQGRTKHED
jgi:predicted HAD superfamily Cof-like phosphohydrolase